MKIYNKQLFIEIKKCTNCLEFLTTRSFPDNDIILHYMGHLYT